MSSVGTCCYRATDYLWCLLTIIGGACLYELSNLYGHHQGKINNNLIIDGLQKGMGKGIKKFPFFIISVQGGRLPTLRLPMENLRDRSWSLNCAAASRVTFMNNIVYSNVPTLNYVQYLSL
ncbi:hypothetical protein ACJX0J_025194 [Zea mays]